MKKLFGFAAIGAAALSLASCGGEETQIGVVLPTSAEPRWLQDEASFRSAAKDAGYEIEIVFSDGDSNKEKSNVETLITKGMEVLILAPHDGTAAGAAAQAAASEDIPVIAYDRLITNTDSIDYYVTFDSVEVGKKQAQYLIDNVETGTMGNDLYLYGGAASDNNAFLFFKGAWEVLQPKIKDGTLEIKNSNVAVGLQNNESLTNSQIGSILDQITTNWDFNTAATLAENNISASTPDDEEVFVLAPNDGTARAIQAKFATVSDTVYITGQDAEKESIQSIIDGKQSMSVLKDTRVLANTAIDMAVAILEGKTPKTDTTYDNGTKDVKSVQAEIFTITINNIEEIIFDGGIFNKSDFNNLTNLPNA